MDKPDDSFLERVTQEYLNQLKHLDSLKHQIDEYKKTLNDAVTEHGEEDEKGHRWMSAGRYLLQRQRRQGKKTLNLDRAEGWAKTKGIWEEVSKQVTVLDEDALLAYVFSHKNEEGLEEEFQELHDAPPVSYAFMKPVEGATYDY